MSGKAVAAADKAINKEAPLPRHPEWPACTPAGKQDDTRQMKATTWQGKQKVKVAEVPVPLVTDPSDAVIKITSTAICGSDLHLYVHAMPVMRAGDVLGHEFMGIVDSVGPDVKTLVPGDRVVVCFDISGCGGACFFCANKLYSSCAASNPSRVQAELYGQPCAGFFGYSHLTGGWQGGQAEYVRVPVADTNCLKVPAGMPDDKVVLLSDILPTAWHACELGEVHAGDVVAIWGAGPVGILAAHCAQHRGAKRVILVDSVQYRLDYARSKLPGVETLNRDNKNIIHAVMEMCRDEPAGAPDVAIDAVGMHYATSLLHKVAMAMTLETDTPEIVNECIRTVRKGGRVSVVGAYAGIAHAFQLGAFMEKQLTMRGGQTPVQRYWTLLLDKVRTGALDPTLVITHHLPLDEAAKGYDMFNSKRPEDGCIKVVLKTAAAQEAPRTQRGEAPAGAAAEQE